MLAIKYEMQCLKVMMTVRKLFNATLCFLTCHLDLTANKRPEKEITEG